MSLTFLAPLFLAGAAAIVIPIVIHLTHRERRDAIPFPSLMFLRKVPFRTVKRQRIRHWTLFLLRVGAILLVVAAFARPLLDNASLATVTLGTAREIVLLIDRSYSMAYGDRWSRATTAAHTTIDGLEPDDRATVVFFSDRAEAATLPTADRATLHAIVDEARPSSQGTQFAPALQLARDILDGSELPRREAVLITDFQQSGWQGQRDLRLPAGTEVRSVDLSSAEPTNLAVTGVLLSRSRQAAANQVSASARVANAGTRAGTATTVTLEIDGQSVQSQTIDIEPGGSVTVRFSPVVVPDRITRGRVMLERDPLPHDDVFHFTVAPLQPIPVLVLQHPNARPNELLYLQQALGIGFDPPFDVEVLRATQLTADALRGRAVVVLDDTGFPQGSAGRALERFVTDGGGLLIVAGQRMPSEAWPVAFAAQLGTLRAAVDRSAGRGGTLSVLDYSHSMFEPFSAPRSGDFSAVRFFRYRRYDPPATGTVLARFDDGAVGLAEIAMGGGRVLVWTSGLANLWNDLPVQPVFLPFVHQAIRYLAHYHPVPSWQMAGDVIDVDADPSAQAWGRASQAANQQEIVIETPSGERFAISPEDGERHVELSEPGFYVARSLAVSSQEPRTIAVNPDVTESDLTPLDPEELIGAVEPLAGGDDRAATLATVLTPTEKERRQGLWWYFLAGALVLLLAEAILAGRLSRTVRRPPTVGSQHAEPV